MTIDYTLDPYPTFYDLYVNRKLSIAEVARVSGYGKMKVQYYLEKFDLTRNNSESKKIRSENVIGSSFFKEINTEEKAYWLGFIVADGNISKNEYRLTINLNIKDKKHLQRFADKFNKKVKEVSRFDKRTDKTYNGVIIEINNKRLIDDLKALGLSSKKSHTLESNIFNNIGEKFKKHFIRGYFDGDGSSNNGRSISLTSCSKKFLINIGNYIDEKLNIQHKRYDRETYCTIIWYKQETLNKIMDYFYKDSTIYLKRKYNILDNIRSMENSRPIWKKEDIEKLLGLTKEDFKNKEKIKKIFPSRTFDGAYRKYRRLQERIL